MTISGILYSVGMILLNILLEGTVFIKFNLWGIRPDSIIVVVVIIALVLGSTRGAIYGLICGLIIDSMFGDFLGLYALIYMLIGVLCGLFRSKYFAQNQVFVFMLAVLSVLFKEGVMALVLSLIRIEFSMGGSFVRYILPSALITGVLAIPGYSFYRRRKQSQIRRSRFHDV